MLLTRGGWGWAWAVQACGGLGYSGSGGTSVLTAPWGGWLTAGTAWGPARDHLEGDQPVTVRFALWWP